MRPFCSLFSNKFSKYLLAVTIVLLVCFTLLFLYVWNKLELIQYSDEIDHIVSVDQMEDTFVDIGNLWIDPSSPRIPNTEVISNEHVLNILLIGTDERSNDFHYAARSDCMILVSINTEQQTVKLVSFERGIGVPILEGEYEGQYDLLTHIFRWGGSELLVKTIEHCFKIDIDHYVRVNFNSVKMIVDEIDGIEVTLSNAEAGAINTELYAGCQVMVSGINHLNGKEALSFARLRKIDSDWQRVERQRKVILAVVEKLKDSDLLTINDLADTVLPMVQTDMSKRDIAGLVLYAPSFLKSSFDQLTIPKQGTYGGMKIRNDSYAFAVDYEINNDLLYRFLYDGVSSSALLAE